MIRTNQLVIVTFASLLVTSLASVGSPPMGPPVRPGAEADAAQLAPQIDEPAQPSESGTLHIRAIQGTPGGPAIGITKVEIHLYGHDGLLATLDRSLDERGEAIIEDIPLGDGVQPIVVIHHAGVTYQKSGPVLDPMHASLSVDVTCYELTEERPAWTVTMRHIMVEALNGGLRVVEILSLENPSERTWLGVPDTNVAPADKRVTTRFALPHATTDVELGKGFHDWCCTTKTDHALVNHLPLMPSGAEMSYSYVVPASDGRVTLDIVAPAPTQNLMVIVPQSLTIAGYEGLTDGGEQLMGETAVHYLMASTLPANAMARITVEDIPGSAVLASGGDVVASRDLVKILAGVGGGLIVLAAFLVVLARPSRAKGTEC